MAHSAHLVPSLSCQLRKSQCRKSTPLLSLPCVHKKSQGREGTQFFCPIRKHWKIQARSAHLPSLYHEHTEKSNAGGAHFKSLSSIIGKAKVGRAHVSFLSEAHRKAKAWFGKAQLPSLLCVFGKNQDRESTLSLCLPCKYRKIQSRGSTLLLFSIRKYQELQADIVQPTL